MFSQRSSSVPGVVDAIVFGAIFVGFAIFPAIAGSYATTTAAYFIIMTFLGISLSLVWGYTGIFSFGQSAFFGVGGYAYGILSSNFGNPNLTLVAFMGALIAAAVVAAFLGYFMFYGGVSDVYVGIATLAVTLGLSTFMYQTAGSKWAVGNARLGGYNGMTGIPALQIPLGSQSFVLQGTALYYAALAALLVTYTLLVMLLRSRFGYAMIATRENRQRTELLGYDVRFVQLIVFTLGGLLAGFSGAMYAGWGNYMTPSTMALTSAALPVIWVSIGGRKSLVAAIIATIALLFVSQRLAGSGDQYALVVFGVLLMVVMLFVPNGIIVWGARRLEFTLGVAFRRRSASRAVTRPGSEGSP